MKTTHSLLLRGILATALGAIFIWKPEISLTYLVMLVGALFAAPGIITLVTYYYRSKSNYPKDISIPIQGVASILVGLCLILIPSFFISFFMVLLGVILTAAAVYQFATLIRARKWSSIPWGLYILPTLLLITGIIILVKPQTIAAYTTIIIGIGILIYGVGELVNWTKLRNSQA